MSVTLTEKCVKEIKHILKDQEMSEPVYVRAGVRGGGCSGFQFVFTIDQVYDEAKDTLIEQDDLKIVVDKRSAMYLDECTIDFLDDLNHHGFKFNTPLVKRTCGCGSSFSMD